LNHWPEVDVDLAMEIVANRCKDADVICNAGDNGEATIIYNLAKYFPHQEYLEVKGNHDYYGGVFKNEFYTREIGPYRFFCATLWTNFNDNPLAETIAARCINDFRYIEGANIETMKKAFYETRKALAEYRPQIVMTHFAPFHKSIDPKYGETPLNYFFCNDMKNTLSRQTQIRLWMHGHTHTPMDYQIDGRKVAANQLGYRGENYRHFEHFYPQIIDI
jgi:predicted phosphodiesterase